MRVYRALVEHVEDLAWQSTHIGGCRFAGTLVCFPQGAYYGRVEPDEVATIVGAFRQQRLYLEKYRGRLSLDPESDVAEYFLRRQTGVRQVGQFHLIRGRVNRCEQVRWAPKAAWTAGSGGPNEAAARCGLERSARGDHLLAQRLLAHTMAVQSGSWPSGGDAGSLDDHRLGARIGPAL
jgi:(2Fe-2S) ferredoxin